MDKVILLILLTMYQETGLIFHTDFETDQWSLVNSAPHPKSTWEYEKQRGEPRTTDHKDSPISKGRGGGRAVWLGSYNNDTTRNEIHHDKWLSIKESWIGFSMRIVTSIDGSRTYVQFRNFRPKDDPAKKEVVLNPLTIRQHPNKKDRLYFAMLTNSDIAYDVPDGKGGASAGSVPWPDHPDGGYGFDYEENVWYDFVVHWKLHPENGFMKIWRNHEMLVDHVGTTNYAYNPISGTPVTGEMKGTIGVYWSKNNKPKGDVIFDHYKMWGKDGSYEKAHPLGESLPGTDPEPKPPVEKPSDPTTINIVAEPGQTINIKIK